MWAEHFNVRWLIRAVQGIGARLNTTISFWLVVLVYVILGLARGRADRPQDPRADEGRHRASCCSTARAQTAARLRRYMVIRTAMSVATGAMVWALATVAGLQLAPEWGVIAFALNYIPFIGPFIATVFPTLYALAQFESLQAALVVFACLNVIQFVIGSYIEPRVSGNALAISPFIVLFSVFFWTWMWGLFGAFIGVPITIAALTFCAQHPVHALARRSAGRAGRRTGRGEIRLDPGKFDPLRLRQHELARFIDAERVNVEKVVPSSLLSITGDGAETMRKSPQRPIQSIWRWPCITTIRRLCRCN